MSILDDAIREHLELKRAHGADESEIKKLEDEAFGPPQRPDEPDPFAEAPTEFLVAPETAVAEKGEEEGGRRAPNIADLQEPPEAPQAEEPATPPAPADDSPAADAPAEEEHPAMEHEAIADPGHTTEERQAIASQPTEMFDVESQFEEAPPEAPAPADEELVDAELSEPSIAPPAADEPADEFDEFFSEQRLSDELNQALEAPLPDEPGGPATEEHAVFADVDEDEPAELEVVEPEGDSEEQEAPQPSSSQHEDVLEDTPDFLEESPEDDDLWFEQKPPKDIDFGD
ncbi:MAG TPA: hypothetical protein VFY48_02635 [Solirubrobacterales bacterium]|nr:hypothetical protein [Solirubrobacterales bacterium]